jgi:hypothetical protein
LKNHAAVDIEIAGTGEAFRTYLETIGFKVLPQ